VRTFEQTVKRFLRRMPRSAERFLVEILRKLGLSPLPYYSFVKCGPPKEVCNGPFKGMKYVFDSVGSSLYAKVLGTYEMELFVFVERLCQRSFDILIDIGCAEGYYAVGFARRMPTLTVHAYDTDKTALKLLRRLAEANGVADRITLGGFCKHDKLNSLLQKYKSPLIISDCEGYEKLLIDPDKAHELLRSTILVELHDHLVEGTSEKIRERFVNSHTIEVAKARRRSAEDLGSNFRLSREEAEAVIQEGRTTQQKWYLMTPNNPA
jgi:hypothetical protein